VFDCTAEQGPLGVLRGSHKGPVVDQYNDKGEWVGCLKPQDAAAIDMSKVDYLEGPAGSVTIHNCRTLHYSKANWSEIPRPLLLNVYLAADAMPYTYNPLQSKYYGAIVRGKPARWAYHDPRPCLLPPDWSGGYTFDLCPAAGGGLGQTAAPGRLRNDVAAMPWESARWKPMLCKAPP
jgi:ectoine hydroxylase